MSESELGESAVAASTATELPSGAMHGAIIGVLIGFTDEGRTPLVIFPGQRGDGAIAARAGNLSTFAFRKRVNTSSPKAA